MSNKGWVAITGAGSGIGRALSGLCAERGYDLLLYDINGAELESAAEEARARGVKVSSRILDVADPSAIAQAAEQVAQEQGAVRMLFNNAGVALAGTFEQCSSEEFNWLMDINFYGVVNMTRTFLPLLRKQEGPSRLVNISSLFGLVAPPSQTAYCAAKYAVRGFTESLRHELDGSSVGVTVVHPGGISTNIANHARKGQAVSDESFEANRNLSSRMLRMAPAEAAQIILDGVERGHSRILVGRDAHFMATLQRLFPKRYWDFIRPLQNRAAKAAQ